MASLVLIIGGVVLIIGGIIGSIHYKKIDYILGRGHAPPEIMLLLMLAAVLMGGLWIGSEVFGS